MSEFNAKVITDSISVAGRRLTTITATYPRMIHSEILTHRDRERNSASSRAIPWPKMMAAITESPFIPIRWGSEKSGMQTGDEIDDPDAATKLWLEGRDNAVRVAQGLADLGVHKSLCNRVTEPWMWITVVMTATEWNNFFRLRCHPDAEIHFQKIAWMIRTAIFDSVPTVKAPGEWHLPFTVPSDFEHPIEQVCMASTARIARVSYLTHEGIADFQKDLILFERLVQGSGFGHWSPHGHVAQASLDRDVRSGPFIGWNQYRKTFANENLPG